MEQFSPLLEPTYRHTLRMWVADPHRNSAILYHSKCPSHTHVVRIRHGFQRGTIVCSSWAHLSTTPHQPLTSRRSPYATPAGWPAALIQAARSPPWRPPHGSRLKRHPSKLSGLSAVVGKKTGLSWPFEELIPAGSHNIHANNKRVCASVHT